MLGIVFRVDATRRHALIAWGDTLSVAFLVLLMLSYVEVAREYYFGGRDMRTAAFMKWLEFEDTLPEGGRRHTAAGRIFCDLLTEEEFDQLLERKDLNDPEVLREILQEEEANRRRTVDVYQREPPPATPNHPQTPIA